jgi:hypothetical protein
MLDYCEVCGEELDEEAVDENFGCCPSCMEPVG